MKYKIADLIVEFNTKFDITNKRAQKYSCEQNRERDFRITVSDEAIQKEKEFDNLLTDDLAEYMIMGTTFYKGLLNYNGCLLHASAVVVENEAYLFSADCGTCLSICFMKLLFSLQLLSIGCSFLARKGPCPLPPFSAGDCLA